MSSDGLISRQEIIASMCRKINDSSINESLRLSIKDNLDNLVLRKIDEATAQGKLSELLESDGHSKSYWSDKNVPKNLYDNIKLYKNGKLSDIQKSKMISSIITRSLIEIEHNSDLSAEDLGINDFIELLSNSINDSIDDDKLNGLLVEYGLI